MLNLWQDRSRVKPVAGQRPHAPTWPHRKGAMPARTEPALTAAALRNRARRDQILSAATKCFVENGFHGSSMAELAKRAGMSVGHIYHYYESKDAIIEAIVDRDIEEAPGMLDAFSGADDLVAAMMDRLAASGEPRVA